MPSVMAWLDESAEQQRRARELVRLGATAESRDELGIGQIRDVYANRLFPGTSVIQTRARYFLFVPWLFQMHEARGRSGDDLLRRVNASERSLIATLKDSALGADDGPDLEGLIGSRAGVGVKILPSAIYWGGLDTFGVLRSPVSPDGLGSVAALDKLDPDAADERVARARSDWDVLDAPPDFPAVVDGGFALTPDEGLWLRERIQKEVEGTLLAHLVGSAQPPLATTFGPWEEPLALTANEHIVQILEEARVFSLVFHGATLLYNLLLARAYEKAGFNRVTGKVDHYLGELATWAEDCEADRDVVAGWDMSAWWREIHSFNPRIGPWTREFASEWLGLVQSGPASRLPQDKTAARLIEQREIRQKKKAQARLVNERLLRNWNGAAGADRLVYRWPTVRRLVTDIVEAAETPSAAA